MHISLSRFSTVENVSYILHSAHRSSIFPAALVTSSITSSLHFSISHDSTLASLDSILVCISWAGISVEKKEHCTHLFKASIHRFNANVDLPCQVHHAITYNAHALRHHSIDDRNLYHISSSIVGCSLASKYFIIVSIDHDTIVLTVSETSTDNKISHACFITSCISFS